MTLRLILSLIVIGVCVRVNFGIDMRCSNCEKNPSMFNCFDIKDGIAQVTFCDVFLSAGYNKTKYILFLFQWIHFFLFSNSNKQENEKSTPKTSTSTTTLTTTTTTSLKPSVSTTRNMDTSTLKVTTWITLTTWIWTSSQETPTTRPSNSTGRPETTTSSLNQTETTTPSPSDLTTWTEVTETTSSKLRKGKSTTRSSFNTTQQVNCFLYLLWDCNFIFEGNGVINIRERPFLHKPRSGGGKQTPRKGLPLPKPSSGGDKQSRKRSSPVGGEESTIGKFNKKNEPFHEKWLRVSFKHLFNHPQVLKIFLIFVSVVATGKYSYSSQQFFWCRQCSADGWLIECVRVFVFVCVYVLNFSLIYKNILFEDFFLWSPFSAVRCRCTFPDGLSVCI